MNSIHLIIFSFIFIAMSLSTAKSCDSPPPEHRRYIGFNQVYYNGDCVGYITDGKFRTFMISDDLLEGFFHLSSDDYDNAYRVWQILGGFNNKGALFNLGVMNYLGVGFNKNYASAANYFNIATQSRTHFNTAYASIVRTLQSSLIELGYLDGYADGDYGIKTETALNRSLSEISPGTHQEFDILGDLYTYFDDIFFDAILLIASAADAQRDITGESNDRDFTCQICLSDKQVHNDQNTPNNESIINIKNIATPSGKINQSQPLPEFQYQTSKKSRKPEELYQMLNDSVHRVFAASRPDDFINYEDISQGSAVAINENLMLTNCHIFENKPYIIFEDSHGIHSGSLHKSDFDRDVCMVSSDIHVLSPVKYTRSYDDIAIGEKIYAIGSPEGFEDTLSDGIVSGKRVNDDMNIIQMTAPITFGSSGGGLFDTYGNLIGITTSGMNSGSLNFAIPIVEYF